jgi:hypothetical protein
MSVLDDYLVDPKLSLLDKTRIQAQVPISILLRPARAKSLSPATKLSCKAHRAPRSAASSRRDNYPRSR